MGFMDKGVLSNGFYGVLLASALCHRVTVYGFLHQWKGSAKYHYYDDVQPDGQQVCNNLHLAARQLFELSRDERTASPAYTECCGRVPEPASADIPTCARCLCCMIMLISHAHPASARAAVVQSLRDVKEANRLAWFVGNRTATHAYGEPCMLGSLPKGQCVGCAPAAATCQPGVWHPVPVAGRCYLRRHPKGDGVPDVRCFHRCGAGDACPGGASGFCPNSLGLHPNALCMDGGLLQQLAIASGPPLISM